MGPKMTNCKDEKINHSDIYLVLIYSGAINVFRKPMQLMFFKEISIFNRLLVNKISCFKSKWFQRRSETWTDRNLCNIYTIHVLIQYVLSFIEKELYFTCISILLHFVLMCVSHDLIYCVKLIFGYLWFTLLYRNVLFWGITVMCKTKSLKVQSCKSKKHW